ncbi:hypothetical protein EVAR_19007_1 [Eumeta japonica]|uniref:Uncharacterized protein n=1 Tax=Eumeta variegata TaxID=151549 RepID=A0A4C1V806_EUMVA|nr:hypothetical protein EVAR_19007_1 [Eumeta japonica]
MRTLLWIAKRTYRNRSTRTGEGAPEAGHVAPSFRDARLKADIRRKVSVFSPLPARAAERETGPLCC